MSMKKKKIKKLLCKEIEKLREYIDDNFEKKTSSVDAFLEKKTVEESQQAIKFPPVIVSQ